MDDIMSALSQAMSDPATAAQVNGLISALSGGGQSEQSPGQSASASPSSSSVPQPPDADMAKLMKIGTAMMQSGQNDPNIALILALKPLLKEETRMKADRIVKIFRLLSAYPMLKDSGII